MSIINSISWQYIFQFAINSLLRPLHNNTIGPTKESNNKQKQGLRPVLYDNSPQVWIEDKHSLYLYVYLYVFISKTPNIIGAETIPHRYFGVKA